MSFYLYFSIFIVEAHSTRSDPQPITLCTKGPDLQIPSIEAKQDGTLRPNYPLAAEPLPDSTVLSTYLYKGADKKHRGAGRLCKQDQDTASTTALPIHIKSEQQESESVTIPASAAASGVLLMSELLETRLGE